MKCPACGSENGDRATFCSLCFGPLSPSGQAQTDCTAPEQPSQPPAPAPYDHGYGAGAPGAGVSPSAVPPTAAPQSSGFAQPFPPQPSASAAQPPQVAFGSSPSDAVAAVPLVAGTAAIAQPQAVPEDPHAGTPLAGLEVPAGAYADALMASERTRPSVMTRKFEVPGAAVLTKLQFAIPLVVFLLVLLGWGIFGGGFKSMSEGKRAVLPIPAGAEEVAVVRELKEGPMGPLSEERQKVFATHIFLMGKPLAQVIDYYEKGEGAAALAKEGWAVSQTWHVDQHRFEKDYTRTKSLGFLTNGRSANEQQTMSLTIDDGGPYSGRKIPEAAASRLTASSCIIRMRCIAAAIQEVRFEVPKP